MKKMKIHFKPFNLFLLLAIGILTMSSTPTVYFIGDSTMADYDPAVYPSQRGWGQMFRNFLTGDISFVNGARNGRSSRSFYTGSDSLWAGVRTKLKAGDYVFIQFAHNDEKFGGLSDTAKLGIGTAPWGDYQGYLRSYVNETRKVGATPILVTSIVRNYFAGDSITYKGRHNLGTDDSTLNYVRAMKAVGRQLAVPVIDHTALTRKYAEGLGVTSATSIIYLSGDQTHLNQTGATIYAQLAVQDMLKQNILTGYLNASPNLIITPASLNFGTSYISAYSSAKISVSGLSLTPATGNVTVAAPNGFQVGLASSGAFAATVQIPYTSGNLAATDLYVHFQPATEKVYADSISISYGSVTKRISVKGNGLSMSSGVDATVNFPLSANAAPTVSGPVIALDESWTGTYVKSYATIATWPAGVTGITVQRTSISATASNVVDTWPANEIDINTSRYIQFAVKPNAGTKLTVDSIGLYAGAAGGSGLRYRVLYSKNAGFSNPVTLEDKTSNTSNTMVALSYKPMIQVADSEGFYLRFYPWYNGTASLKYLCLSNLTIKGRVSTMASGVETLKAASIQVYPNPSTGVYNLQSTERNSVAEIYNQTGILVKKQRMDNPTIDLSDCPTGIYVLKLQSDQQSKAVLLVKK
ncbi:MAG: T9SS type A sorting domain-containing protein [Paludibacter sp.]|nr:T9SS type A sorting domain-containing protein [Paludibacter sp.]